MKPITNKTPEAEPVTLSWVYDYVCSEKAKHATETLRAINDERKQSEFKKQNFDYITPSGTFIYHSDASLVQHSAILCMDIDDVGHRLEELFNELLQD